jgi:TrmH family RNA methyltransferase
MITSVQNQRVKALLRLDKAHERRRQGLFLIEGGRELAQALAGGYIIRELWVCESLLDDATRPLTAGVSAPVEAVSEAVFEKLAYRGGRDGVVAVAEARGLRLDDLRLSACPYVLALETVEKPGNLGAMLRTADAAQVDAVIVCDPQTDVYNPNAIRASLGCLFSTQVAVCTSAEALQWMRNKGLRVFAAELTAAEWYYDCDFCQPAAVVVGAEADGLTAFWLDNADARIKIPMRGKADSLNVSVSAAVITFEAMRQREKQTADRKGR